MQLVAPLAFWYRPAPHRLHVACRRWLLYVPGLHSVALAEPTAQKVPAAHSMHCASLVIGVVSVAS